MGKALDRLLDLLDLEQIEVNIFRGRSPEERGQRVFGGQVAGQALVAAGRTVPADRPVHSLHAYFIRPGDPAVPIIYLVDRVRDGRSFTTRRVSAVQHGEAIFTLSASFHHPEPGPEHADPMPDVPPPDEVERNSDRLARLLGQTPPAVYDNPIDLRSVGPMSAEAARDPSLRTTRNLIWLRVDGDLPDDPLLHVCLMTYASDMTLLDSVLLGHGLSWLDGRTSGASLDHAMWFHRPFRADRWLLYAQDSPVASGARGLATGQVFTAEGELVVSVVQEGLIRAVPPPLTPPPNGPGQPGSVPGASRKTKTAGQKSVAPFRGQHLRFSTCPWASNRRSWKGGARRDELLLRPGVRLELGFAPGCLHPAVGLLPGDECARCRAVRHPRRRASACPGQGRGPRPAGAEGRRCGQTNIHNYMTGATAVGEGASGPPREKVPV